MSSLITPGLLSRVNNKLSNFRATRKRRLGLFLAALCVFAATASVFFYVSTRSANITYFSKASGLAPELVTSWSTTRDGLGTPPPNFTSGDTFAIQNGHNMTNVAAWSISGANSKLQIEDGGTLTANVAVTLNSATTFQIDGGGTYVHNNNTAYGSTIFNGTENFDATSTVILNNSSTTGPSNVAFGNLTVNFTTDPGGSVNLSGAISTINGDLTITNTQTREFRITASANVTLTIGGNLTIQGGTLNLSSGAGVPTINLSGNYNQTGGTLTSTGSGIGSINFTGGSSFVTFTQSAGTLTNTNINWSIANGKIVQFNNAFTNAASRTFDINTGGMLLAAATITNSGTVNVFGEFRLTDGGFATGTNFVYGVNGTLGFVSSGSYVVGNDAYWPTTNGPVNVNVLGLGMTLNVARTVTGLFQYSAGVSNAGNLTLNGTSQVNAGGFMSGSPTYGAASLLKYNTGTNYGRNGEWLPGATSGAGYPNHVQLSNNTTLELPNGSNGSTFQLAGGLQIDAGSALNMGAMTQALSVLGSVQNEGTLTLSTVLGGDIKVGDNWTRGASATFTPNNRAVIFNGSILQTIQVLGGGTETFNYLVVAGPSTVGTDTFLGTTNVVVNGTSGDVLQLLGGDFGLVSGTTLTLSGDGGNILTSGGARSITGQGTVNFTGFKAVTSATSGTLNFANTVNVNLSNGVNFGGVSTVNGVLTILAGGFVNTNPPTYAAGSTLQYDNGTTFNAAAEFPSTGVKNVALASTTQLNLDSDKTIAGSFNVGGNTIGSTAATPFSLDASAINLGSGTINVNNLTTSSLFNVSSTGTVNVAGNWNVASFGANSSTVNFNGTGAQNVQTATTFNNLTASNDITLGASPTVNGTLALGSKKITTDTNTLNVGNSATVTRTSGYIIGNESKNFSSVGSHVFTFDVGTANGYSPVDTTISISNAGNNTLTVTAVEGQHPNIAGADALQRYWTLSNSFVGTGVADLTFHYLAGDVQTSPAVEDDYDVFKFNPVFTNMGGAIDTVNHTATVTGVSSFSDWTLAVPASVNGEIRFAQANTNDSETNADHTVNIAVQRTGGGSSGEVSVTYTVTDGTANAGSDYTITPATDTLTWPDGDTADKNITITVEGDTTYEANETVGLTLSSPTGGAV
ncbi:MAG TPA: Calx-beta domain-containing protein, partial [Pyrinomonadaceae bacterium]|nr:Calx-beta domain-containing protein [Pyrinomonadaceae bacterium]